MSWISGLSVSEIEQRQQRLDKVLEAFKQIRFNTNRYYRYEKEYKGNYFFVLDYDDNKKQFYLMKTEIDIYQNFDNVYMPIDIELAEKLVATVEHLIADMEAHNEKINSNE